jgi:hypothetical protein
MQLARRPVHILEFLDADIEDEFYFWLIQLVILLDFDTKKTYLKEISDTRVNLSFILEQLFV